jgi:dGTPase
MTIRESLELMEKETLSPYAALSVNSKGRDREEPQCDIRTDYQRDRDRILHCKAFRRLKSKTQVFLDPQGDHYRTRLTHTLEVSQNARTIGKALRMNEELIEAIALGHDLGHTPFGHAGERTLNKLCSEGFKHNEQSVRIVEKLEKNGQGLNLTWEVRDGILKHQIETIPETLEGRIVRLSDKIAYINHDIDDAIRGGIIRMDDLPQKEIGILGNTHSERINNLIVDLCRSSEGRDSISLSPEFSEALLSLRSFMFANVYNSTEVLDAVDAKQADLIITSLYSYFLENPDQIPGIYKEIEEEDGTEVAVKDLISGMTDRKALNLYDELFGRGQTN